MKFNESDRGGDIFKLNSVIWILFVCAKTRRNLQEPILRACPKLLSPFHLHVLSSVVCFVSGFPGASERFRLSLKVEEDAPLQRRVESVLMCMENGEVSTDPCIHFFDTK